MLDEKQCYKFILQWLVSLKSITWVRADLANILQRVTTIENKLIKFDVVCCTLALMLLATVSTNKTSKNRLATTSKKKKNIRHQNCWAKL